MTAIDTKESQRSWFSRITLLIVCVLWTIPTIGLLVTSLRDKDAVDTSGWWTALTTGGWTTQNYDEVLSKNDMAGSFVNSIIIAVPATVIPIMFAAFAAYAFTFMHFFGRDFLFVVVVALLVVPLQVALVPIGRLFGPLGLDITGQFLSVWLLHTGFGMPLAIYILRNYMATLPKAVIESAQIDGATHYQTFWRLIVPMSVPALASFAIFQFLWVWNDLLVALLFVSGADTQPLTVTLSRLLGSLGQNWQLLTAGAFISMTLPLIVFFSLQRFFVRGLTAGADKG
jgi:alpha-glucoside transport system permease protein